MRIEQYCIAVAATAALCGMGLGIFMATNHDFTLMPAHAHLNLLGWVSMALYGLYYRGAALLRIRLAWIQAGIATVGFVTMTGALAALLLTLDPRFEPLIGVGASLSLLAMALFLFQVVIESRPTRIRDTSPLPAEGTFPVVEHG
ncbi:hypothetical protein [Amaricoccus sp.]|uniref:hypothetical protein n=1 Tax=Amaricoccus sp. TaxID=1872485 RepID=UPI002636A06B|nr:hypothetical protein [Amaricoccus sp.]HRO12555.1 hypothetical protein [Amaricoccus sp.]